MKFLVFGPRLWNSTWGHAQELCLHLARKGHKIIYVEPLKTSDKKKPNSLNVTANNKKHENIKITKSMHSYPLGILYVFYSTMFYAEVEKYADYDVSVFYDALSAYGLLKKRKGKLKVFNFVDECLLTKRWARFLYQHVLLVNALKKSDLVITTAKALDKKARLWNDKVFYLPNGVDLSKFKNNKKGNKKVIGFIGSLGFWINAKLLIALAWYFKNYEFLIAGGGVQLDYLQKNKLPNMKLLGFINHEDVPRFLKKISVGLIPFYKNKITDAVSPIKLFEYWASGTPVIATPTEELKKLKCKGLLLANSEKEWIEKINYLLRDKNWQKTRKCALSCVKYFDWKTTGEVYEKIIEKNIGS